jgi:hypothetical protein
MEFATFSNDQIQQLHRVTSGGGSTNSTIQSRNASSLKHAPKTLSCVFQPENGSKIQKFARDFYYNTGPYNDGKENAKPATIVVLGKKKKQAPPVSRDMLIKEAKKIKATAEDRDEMVFLSRGKDLERSEFVSSSSFSDEYEEINDVSQRAQQPP